METLEERAEGEPSCLLMRSEETGSRGAMRASAGGGGGGVVVVVGVRW